MKTRRAPAAAPAQARDPLLDVANNLARIGLSLEGVAEGIRSVLDRQCDEPLSHAEDCLLQLLYERLDDEAATLVELEKTITERVEITKGGG